MDNQKTLLLGTTDLKYGDFETERSKRRKRKIFGCSILSIALIVLIVVLSVTLTKKDENNSTVPETPLSQKIEAVMNRNVDPCADFYEFACGGWLGSTPIPSDDVKSSRGYQGGELQARNEIVIKQVLEADWPLIGPHYQACMNLAKRNSLGTSVLNSWLQLINSMTTIDQFMNVLVQFHMTQIPLLFAISVQADLEDPTMTLTYLSQGRVLGLPGRSYYIENRNATLISQYQQHITNVLQLLGETNPSQQANYILQVENTLANYSVGSVEYNNIEKSYNPVTLLTLQSTIAPTLNWTYYFSSISFPQNVSIVSVSQMNYLNQATQYISSMLTSNPEYVQAYAKWQLIRTVSPILSESFMNASFYFFDYILKGQQQMEPLWKRCYSVVNSSPLGMLIGRYFVQVKFPPESRAEATTIWNGIKQAFDNNLPNVEWIDEPTRIEALKKSENMVSKIGYPDIWPDLSGLTIYRDNLFQNWLNLNQFSFSKSISRVGGTVDENYWSVPPQTVTAYNRMSPNEIAVPAGIIQEPYFDISYPPPMNYGGIGMVCGHELTHGFDNQGRKFDSQGKLRDWWSTQSSQQYDIRQQCFVNQYSQFEVQPGLFLNGNFTIGENIADNGGLKETFLAYQATHPNEGNLLSIVPGFTNNQLFFINFGQIWCFKMTPEYERFWVATNSHSTPKYRVIGALTNSQEFSSVFNCPLGSPMNPPNKCSIW